MNTPCHLAAFAPIEPPLQIWRCPMGVSYERDGTSGTGGRLYDILFGNPQLSRQQSHGPIPFEQASTPRAAVLRRTDGEPGRLPDGLAFRLVQDRADIDISGPEFNFVRSIRVFDVRRAWQRESRDDCSRSAVVFLGTYGTQGDFAWQRSSIAALPDAHVGLEQWGDNCPSIYHRSVFVDWQDYEGNYGFEQVNY